MTSPPLSARQQQLAAASAAALASARAAAEARQGRPAAGGDRYLLAATSGFPVEWVVLQRHPELPRLLAVLADTHPLVGSADFALPAGALHLRGGALVWLDESALDPALRVGALDPVTLEKARRKILGKEPPSGEPDSLVQVDASPEYREWRREVVAPALAAMGAPALTAPAHTAPREERKPRLPAVAAAVFLLLALGLAGWAGWRQRQPVRETQALHSAGEAPAAEPRPAQALINVPVALLNPAELLRGEEAADSQALRLGADAPHLMVVLNLDSAVEYPSYRAVLTRQGSAAPLWQSDQLRSQDHRIAFALERRLLPPGDYRFELHGLRAGRAEALAETLGYYELAIR